jgi:hypothetical protein
MINVILLGKHDGFEILRIQGVLELGNAWSVQQNNPKNNYTQFKARQFCMWFVNPEFGHMHA